MTVKTILLLVFLAFACEALSQDIGYVSYYNRGLLRQPSAERDRAYLGLSTYTLTVSSGFAVGTNIGLTTNINVIIAGGTTNQLKFTGGILTGVVPQ